MAKKTGDRGRISREDFVFTIGYDGPAAVVDSQARRRYGGLSTAELADRGLFRAAYSSAVYSGDPAELETLTAAYNKTAGTSYTPASPLDRLFGVFPVEAKRVVMI